MYHTHCIAVQQEYAMCLAILLHAQIEWMRSIQIDIALQRKCETKINTGTVKLR